MVLAMTVGESARAGAQLRIRDGIHFPIVRFQTV
jgi:hypothetical protein